MARRTETMIPPGTYRTLRFRGIEAKIDIDGVGEYVDVRIPTQLVPSGLIDGLKEFGLSESQTEEVLETVADMTAMNYLLAKRE